MKNKVRKSGKIQDWINKIEIPCETHHSPDSREKIVNNSLIHHVIISCVIDGEDCVMTR